MTFEHLFSSYWWLMFPIFWMVMSVWRMLSGERRTSAIMRTIRTYVEQGKEPPPELLKLASRVDWDEEREERDPNAPAPPRSSNAWSFITFAAISAGFGTGYYLNQTEDWAFAFLIVAVVMGVMAVGALAILISGRK